MNDLIKVENISPLELFTKSGVDPLLQAITEEVRKFVPDISTKKGQSEVASMAHKVAKTKVYLDDLGKALTEDWKKQAKVVDESRRKIRDYLDNLKDEVRAPLTLWENKEKERVANHEANVIKITSFKLQFGASNDSASLREAIFSLESIVIDESWDEFKMRAERSKAESLAYLNDLLIARTKHEQEQEELKRLREEAAAKEQKEREERIAKEAAERATKEAEERAEAQRKKDSDEKFRLEREKLDAELRAEKAEQEKKAEAERAERRQKEAEERAREEERLKIQREKEAQEKEQAKREASLRHTKKVNNEALSALLKIPGVNEELGKAMVTAIAKGEIPHIKISY